MKRVYIKESKQLAYLKSVATSEFWDEHWDDDNLRETVISCTDSDLIMPVMRRYLPDEKGVILEGGCGRGSYCHCMQLHGYNVVGIDFAEETVRRVNKVVPELDIRLGDVRKLPFGDNSLAGYWSLGVVEHFYRGYDDIVSEMYRTIRPGGYLFITFPYMSPVRNLKARFGSYLTNTPDNIEDVFYQFTLNSNTVIDNLKELGFELVERRPFDGIKGFKDEFRLFRSFLQEIYDGKRYFRFQKLLDRILSLFASHSILLVMKKR